MARRIVLAGVVALLLAVSVPAAAAGSTVTVRGRPHTAQRLAAAVTLPNGQSSTMTFTLRRRNGANVRGFAVATTRFYENFNFEGDTRVPRSAAYRIYRRYPEYAVRGKLVYRPYVKGGKTYRVLVRVQYVITGE